MRNIWRFYWIQPIEVWCGWHFVQIDGIFFTATEFRHGFTSNLFIRFEKSIFCDWRVLRVMVQERWQGEREKINERLIIRAHRIKAARNMKPHHYSCACGFDQLTGQIATYYCQQFNSLHSNYNSKIKVAAFFKESHFASLFVFNQIMAAAFSYALTLFN